MRKTLFYKLLIAVVIVAIVFWGYISFQKPARTNISEVHSSSQVRAGEIIGLFQRNESAANTSYINKVIVVQGTIKEISFLNQRKTVILESEKFKNNFIICEMSPLSKDRIPELTIGDTISLKGICKGYLLDVILLNCIPTDEKP